MYQFLSTGAAKFGVGFWKPGSGIIHQVRKVEGKREVKREGGREKREGGWVDQITDTG